MPYPSREEFKKLAKKGNVIPVCQELLADMETPVSAYHKIASPQGAGGFSFLLESVEGGENIARYSFLGARPRATLIQNQGAAVLSEAGTERVIEGKDFLTKLRSVMARYKPVEIPGLPPFAGGAVGYLSYDIVSEFEPTVPRLPPPFNVPEAFFMITDAILAFDRVSHTIKIVAHAFTDECPSLDQAYDQALQRIDGLRQELDASANFRPVPLGQPPEIPEPESNMTRERFLEIVDRCKEYIVAGDIIQTVLSQRFSTPCDAAALSLHRALRTLNPSPYMFLLDCGGFSLVGASPEVHARCENGVVTVRPIAGTRRRGGDPKEDQALAKELLADPKERAEHVMLVDLARNDVGRVAALGTVKVHEFMTVERYSHVMHIVSDVRGKLDIGKTADDVMRSTFPAGTLSGAPKVRAMQIIGELEGVARGPYGGAVAYWSFNGNLDSCITIRTALLKDGMAHVQAGAGIVADSVPESEFEETRNKAKAVLKAIAMAETLH